MVPIGGYVPESRAELDKAGFNLTDLKGCEVHAEPGEPHIRMIKRGLRYLRGKLDLGLVYDFRQPPVRQGLYGYFDASHADDVDGDRQLRMSFSSLVVRFHGNRNFTRS